MSEAKRKLSEQYYVFHLRAMVLTLLMLACMAAYNLVKLYEPSSDRSPLEGLAGATAIVIVYVVGLFAVQFVTLGGRRWKVRDPHVQAILHDEWTSTNSSRAMQIALWVVLVAQWPMMFFMAYTPPTTEASVIGMGTMTWFLGIGGYFASYLYLSRQQNDG